MSENAPRPKGWTALEVNNALGELEGMRGNMSPTGAITDEHDDISQLIAAVKSGKMHPTEALMKAKKKDGERQNYH